MGRGSSGRLVTNYYCGGRYRHDVPEETTCRLILYVLIPDRNILMIEINFLIVFKYET